MAINSKHPLYNYFLDDWELCRDSYKGERAIKEKGVKYLPATSGQQADGMQNAEAIGMKAYTAYKTRAVYHEYPREAVEKAIGVMWQKPPVIKLPKVLEPLLDKATTKNESLFQLLRRMNEEQLMTGRLGLLLDLPNTPTLANTVPYIAMYYAENIINWDAGTREEVATEVLNLVVLDETAYERNKDFDWELVYKYRTLVLGEADKNETAGSYKYAVFEGSEATFNEALLQAPVVRGKGLDKIPFVFVNSKDMISEPDTSPLLGLCKLSLAIYRGEADYRQSLFMQGQDTLVVTGSTEESFRVGSNATIVLPNQGDAKYIGVSSQGLPEQRQALENDKAIAANKAGNLIDTRSREKEGGDAMRMRVAAQTATYTQIALTAAEALEYILKIAAEWVGANPKEVEVIPNLDFTSETMLGKELLDLTAAKNMGAPISNQSIHKVMQQKGLTEMEYEDEVALLEEEQPTITEPTDEVL